MKENLKAFLKFLRLYHPLQSFYRQAILFLQNNYYKLTFLKYKGRGYICNFCGASYEKFVPEYPSKNDAAAINKYRVIAGYGENVHCPNCMSKNRDRLLLAVMQNFLQIEKKRILHFSPEKHLYNFLKDKAKVTTVDIIPGFYKNIDSAISYADATALRFPDNSFDVIIANHILEHIPEDIKAMTEMQRVLKEDGVAILQVPYSTILQTTIEEPSINDPARQQQLFGQKDHVRIYAFDDYIQRLTSAGFSVKILPAESFGTYKQYAIQEGEHLILGYKLKKENQDS